LFGISLLLFWADFGATAFVSTVFVSTVFTPEVLGAGVFAAGVLAGADLAIEAFAAGALTADALTGDTLAGVRVVVRVSLTGGRAGPLLTLRLLAPVLLAVALAAAVFFEALEILFLRVFCDTACAWILPRPCLIFIKREPGRAKNERHHTVQLLECAYNSTFPAKINDLCPLAAVARPQVGHNQAQGKFQVVTGTPVTKSVNGAP
jgi:hypothetical protein